VKTRYQLESFFRATQRHFSFSRSDDIEKDEVDPHNTKTESQHKQQQQHTVWLVHQSPQHKKERHYTLFDSDDSRAVHSFSPMAEQAVPTSNNNMTDEKKKTTKKERKSCFRRFKSGTSYQWQVVKAHPRIGCVTLTIFMILCGIGLGVVYGIRHRHITEFEDQGLQLAQDTGDFFCKSFVFCLLVYFGPNCRSSCVYSIS
jgi:hypothetical protein